MVVDTNAAAHEALVSEVFRRNPGAAEQVRVQRAKLMTQWDYDLSVYGLGLLDCDSTYLPNGYVIEPRDMSFDRLVTALGDGGEPFAGVGDRALTFRGPAVDGIDSAEYVIAFDGRVVVLLFAATESEIEVLIPLFEVMARSIVPVS